MILYDFKCSECGHVHEDLAHMDQRLAVCPVCGGPASREVSAASIKLDGTDPGFPGAYSKWARDRLKRNRELDKKEGL